MTPRAIVVIIQKSCSNDNNSLFMNIREMKNIHDYLFWYTSNGGSFRYTPLLEFLSNVYLSERGFPHYVNATDEKTSTGPVHRPNIPGTNNLSLNCKSD